MSRQDFSQAEAPRHPAFRRAVAGVLLAVLGSAGLSILVLLAYAGPPGYEATLLHVGMPLTVLASAAAQVAVLVGAWLLWTAVHHPRG